MTGNVRRPAQVLVAAVLLLVAACVHEPGVSSRERPLEAASVALTGPALPGPDQAWWQELQDPQLDQLIETALARNPGITAALARVRVAREQAAIAGALQQPQLGLDATVTRERFSENYLIPPPYGGGTYWEGRLGLNLSWHLDFWGRQAALVEQAGRSADAAALDAVTAELMLTSAVAQAYVEFARAQQLEQLALQTQAQRNALLRLTRERVGAGLDSMAELRAAESSVEQSAVDIAQAQLAAELAGNALATLTATGAATPLALTPPVLRFDGAPAMPQALPADLLARRPDVRAARLRIDAATAGRAAAHANFYPNVDLVAFAGVVAIGLDDLLQGDSRQWSVGPAVHLPVFDAGRLKAEYRRAGAEVDAAVAAYNESVLRAVREAADQSSRLRSCATQLAAQQRALNAAEQAYDLAVQRYGAGITSQVTVLNTETQLLAARRQRTQLLADCTSARIALRVALGGHIPQEPVR
jgi:NodT family efflux transporter outer membrane factor (OMF) lipoprotein